MDETFCATFCCCVSTLYHHGSVIGDFEHIHLLVVGEGLHGVQQLGDRGAEQADGHGLCQVLSCQVEHARCGHQVDVQGGGVVLHPTQHQLQGTRSLCHNHMCFRIRNCYATVVVGLSDCEVSTKG